MQVGPTDTAGGDVQARPEPAAYRYDGLDRRIEKDANGAITRYVYDGSYILLEYDGASTLLARYSHGQSVDQPLAVERGGQSYYYQADQLGSVRAITDSAGLTANSYDYDAYGNIEASVEGIANPFTYTGREFDAESGLYFYRARYYDPATGRFLTEDPIGLVGGFNIYAYVDGNPVNFVDPTGEAKNVGTAVKLVGTAMKKLGQLTKDKAARRRRQGENVKANSKQQARQTEIDAHGQKDLRRHKGHMLEDGSIGSPHYQTNGKSGHTFWSIIGPIGAGLACAGDYIEKFGEAAEDALIDFSLNPFDSRPAY